MANSSSNEGSAARVSLITAFVAYAIFPFTDDLSPSLPLPSSNFPLLSLFSTNVRHRGALYPAPQSARVCSVLRRRLAPARRLRFAAHSAAAVALAAGADVALALRFLLSGFAARFLQSGFG